MGCWMEEIVGVGIVVVMGLVKVGLEVDVGEREGE